MASCGLPAAVRAGAHHTSFDPLPCQLLVDCLGKASLREFGHGVDRLIRMSNVPRYGGNENDPSNVIFNVFDLSCRYAADHAIVGDILQHYGVCTNLDIVADGNIAKYPCTCAHDHIIQ